MHGWHQRETNPLPPCKRHSLMTEPHLILCESTGGPRWTHPIHNQDLTATEPLLQKFSCDGHGVEVTESPVWVMRGRSDREKEERKKEYTLSSIGIVIRVLIIRFCSKSHTVSITIRTDPMRRKKHKWRGTYIGVLSSAWCPGGRTTAKPFCQSEKREPCYP